jgi:hypothetical protein
MVIRMFMDGVTKTPLTKRDVLTTPIVLSWLLVVATAGCGHKSSDTNTQIDQAVQAMAHAKTPPPTEAADSSASPVPTPVQQMNDALVSYKAGDYETAVTRFQTIRVHTVMTGEQLLALNNALTAVMGDLYARAAKGDAAAVQAVKQYEQMQRQRH